MSDIPRTMFTDKPLGAAYARAALPIIFVIGMNGLLSVTDAFILGQNAGPQALPAVTMMFPVHVVIVAAIALTGPPLTVAMPCQAIGHADRAALLGLSKPFLFAIPLSFGLAIRVGETGVWLAGPLAVLLLLALTLTVFHRHLVPWMPEARP